MPEMDWTFGRASLKRAQKVRISDGSGPGPGSEEFEEPPRNEPPAGTASARARKSRRLGVSWLT